MAQSRTHKVGTIYSRVRGLILQKALKEENKPLWYDIYEAFPPKYEPRVDRHLIAFGAGSNLKNEPAPPKILYKEDFVRAQYYKAFMPKNETFSPNVASSEVFNLMDDQASPRKTLSQIFLEKYNKLRAEGKYSDDDLFVATVDALESDGIVLKGQPESQPIRDSFGGEVTNQSSQFVMPSMKDLLESSQRADNPK